MLVPSLISLAIAIVTFYLSAKATDEILQLAIALPASCFLLYSLIVTPWLIKLSIAIGLLVCKKHASALIEAPLRVREIWQKDCPLEFAFVTVKPMRKAIGRREPAWTSCSLTCRYALPCRHALRWE